MPKINKPPVEYQDTKPQVKEEPKKLDPNEIFQAINGILIENPEAAQIEHVFDEGRSFYQWIDNTNTSKRNRKKIREALNILWQSGAYNYATIARKLRLTELEVQGLMDEQLREKFGLNY